LCDLFYIMQLLKTTICKANDSALFHACQTQVLTVHTP
jgi:hypothetical protein